MKVVAFNRTLQGTGASRRLRKAGQTPGIIYGGEAAPVLISLDGNALWHALKKEAFHGSVLDLEIEGATQQVLLRDFQMHAYKQLVLHADFQRVDSSQPIHTKVALHFINADISVHLARPPVGEWIRLSSSSTWEATGIGAVSSELSDVTGPFGRANQALVLEAREYEGPGGG